jgi:RNA polymerase sigma-70 factor (ECF subfamily)
MLTMPIPAQGDERTVARDQDAPKLRLVGKDRTGHAPTPSPLDDVQLLAALRANDVHAATAFHDRVRPQVDRTILRLLGRRDVDHEDLVQLSLIELIYSVDRFRGDCSLDSWTATITAHVVYKHLRRRGTERRIFALPPADEFVASGQLPSSDVVLRNLVVRVRQHLDRIAPAKAWAFLLHDVCGYDLREAAQIMNVTVAAAQRRLVRGRWELHELIGADPELVDWKAEVGE